MIPADAELTPRDEAFPAWDDVPDKLKPFYARQMEVYAGYSENADYNVGRVIDAIDELGELDNTLIIWIWGDNGASMEGTITGSFNELTMQNGIPLTDEMQLQLAERYGGDRGLGRRDRWIRTTGRRGRGPATPRSSGASRSARTSAAPATRWSSTGRTRITDAGGLRSQFTHVIDVAPTILDIAGIPVPTSVDGIEQEPMHGVDVHRHRSPTRRAPEHHTQQYFETIGNRAMYKDGWWLAMKTARIPWVAHPRGPQAVRPGRLGPGRRSDRAVLPARRLHPGARPGRRASGEGRGAEGAVLAGGRAVQGAAAAGDPVDLLRHAAAAARRAPGSSSAATSRTCCRG